MSSRLSSREQASVGAAEGNGYKWERKAQIDVEDIQAPTHVDLRIDLTLFFSLREQFII